MTASSENHLDEAMVARYLSGALSGAETDTVIGHLGACPRCSERVLDALEAKAPSADLEATDADVAAGVEAVMERVARLPAPTRDRPRRLGSPRAGSRGPIRARPLPWGWLAAAALLAVLVGMTLQSLRRPAAGVSDRLARGGPIADAPVIDLLPPGVLRNQEATGPTVRIANDAPFQTLLLTPPDPRPAVPARLLIRDLTGEERWRGDLRANDAGSFSLALPGGFLSPGRYDLVLQPEDAGPDAVTTYALEIVAAPPRRE